MTMDSSTAAAHDPHLRGSALGPLTGDFGSPDAPDCIFWYDQPLMWLARDPYGQDVLVQWVDEDTTRALLAVIPIRAAQAAWLRDPEIDLGAAADLAVRAIAEARADAHAMLLCTVTIDDLAVISERPASDAEIAAVTPDGRNDSPVPRLDTPQPGA